MALVALLALIFWLVWETTHSEPGQSLVPSTATSSVIGSICLMVAVAAGGYAIFIIIRAFYLGFTRPELRDIHDRNA